MSKIFRYLLYVICFFVFTAASSFVPSRLEDLNSDVSISSPSNGDVLQYDSTSKKWKNAAGGGSMVYPVAGLPISTGSAWGTSLAEVDGDIVYGSGGAWIVSAPPTWNQSTTGNAATATALASAPTTCSTGQAPTGINTAGNAQSCTTYSQQTFGTLTNGDWCNTNGTSISCQQAAPQAAGNYITALTGDVTASGPGSVAASVVKVNGASVPASALIAGTNSSSQIIQQFAEMNTSGINWNNFTFDLANINWADMTNLFSTTGINWANNTFNTGGINWDTWKNVGTAGINWNSDIFNTVRNFYYDGLYDNGTCTTAATIDPKNGHDQKITLTNGDACALTFTQPSSGTATVDLEIIQSSVSTYNGTISGCKWDSGTVMTPTASNGAVDWISIKFTGATTYCGKVGQNFS